MAAAARCRTFACRHQLGTFLREALLALRLLYLKLTPAFTSNTDHLMHSNAVDRTLARTNHSCCNNASYHFKADGTVIMRAVALITEGSEITISYVRDKFALERCGPPGELEAKAGYPVGALCLSLHLRQDMLAECYACLWNSARCVDAAHPPRDWFLDAVAADDVAEAMRLTEDLRQLIAQGTRVLLEQGNASQAAALLEAGVANLVAAGVHSCHQFCADVYILLGSAWRMLARSADSSTGQRKVMQVTERTCQADLAAGQLQPGTPSR
eukprot:jgi/Astpho2/9165/fgenesh1_pg.00135_%23_20_t